MSHDSRNEPRALSRYLREIRQLPLLGPAEEKLLVCRVEKGDPEAVVSLIESNLSFVVKIAAEYRSLGVPFEDLLNDGNLGLIEATRRFDPGRGNKFITYAIWWIRKAILESIANHAIVVRMPAYRRKKVYEFRKAETTLRNRLDRLPTSEETARHLKVSISDIDKLRCLHLAHSSLDRKIGAEDSPSPLEFLKDDRSSAEDNLLSEEAGAQMARAFERLTKREKDILGWRLGLGGQSPLTLKQIGKQLDISRERVRQIENEAKQRLRRWVAASMRSD